MTLSLRHSGVRALGLLLGLDGLLTIVGGVLLFQERARIPEPSDSLGLAFFWLAIPTSLAGITCLALAYRLSTQVAPSLRGELHNAIASVFWLVFVIPFAAERTRAEPSIKRRHHIALWGAAGLTMPLLIGGLLSGNAFLVWLYRPFLASDRLTSFLGIAVLGGSLLGAISGAVLCYAGVQPPAWSLQVIEPTGSTRAQLTALVDREYRQRRRFWTMLAFLAVLAVTLYFR